MQSNIIEISNDNRELCARRGFLCIKEHGETLAEIPFDSLCAVMATGRAIIYTNNLMRELCENGIPLVIVGENFHPAGMLLPVVGQTRQMAVQANQIAASRPLQKQLWATIVREKIRNQSRVLDLLNRENRIKNLVANVASGDTGCAEPIAARMYFPALFGADFLRERKGRGINSFLNYGYAVLRAAMARLIVAAGLNPSFGIQHHNKQNPFCLADDLMEVYRPLVDAKVYKIFGGMDDSGRELTPSDKAALAALLDLNLRNGNGLGASPLLEIMRRDVWAFAHSLEEKKNLLDYINVIQD